MEVFSSPVDYRTEVLRREQLSFTMDMDKGVTPGKRLYFELVDRSYRTVELPMRVMARHVIHLAHATQVVNLQEFSVRRKTARKCNRLIHKVLSAEPARSILADESLDR
jgi:hypothetical protein